MPLTLHESRRRTRRQRRTRFYAWMFVIVALIGAGYAAFATGAGLRRFEVLRLQKEKENLQQRIVALEEENAMRQAATTDARLREQEWRQRYERDVPTGISRQLLGEVEERLADGVHPERLALALDAAVNEPACDNKPVTKRFIVRTPLHAGGNDVVSFADNAITVTAEGQSSKDEGRPRSIFDPAEPVTVSFTLLGGKSIDASGVLPLHRSVIVNGSEYRFSVIAAETRGLVHVTADRCKAPQ